MNACRNRGVFKVVLAVVYVLGWPFVMATLAIVAYQRRETHGMTPAAAALLALVAGMVWPLLAVAAVQIGLVGLATLPGRLRSRTLAEGDRGHASESVNLEMAVA